MKRFMLLLLSLTFLSSAAAADDALPWKNKQITMIIGFAAGGGTDSAGRLIARFLGKYLPGQPTFIVRNQPGADGITALNYMMQQTKPDGLYVAMGSSSQVDPLHYRAAKALYDPSQFAFLGGVGRGRSFLLIRTESEPRLNDRTLSPVMMGSVGVPRSSMQSAAWGIEYLGWNVKWVMGYRGTNEVLLALSRGEIDMSSTDLSAGSKMLETGKFKVVAQTGSLDVGRTHMMPEIEHAPIFRDLMSGKIQDPIARQAFDYWLSFNSVDKWLALMPDTPSAIVAVYRDAFVKASADPEFIELGTSASEDFSPIDHKVLEDIVRTLAATPPEAIDHLSALLRKQGIDLAH